MTSDLSSNWFFLEESWRFKLANFVLKPTLIFGDVIGPLKDSFSISIASLFLKPFIKRVEKLIVNVNNYTEIVENNIGLTLDERFLKVYELLKVHKEEVMLHKQPHLLIKNIIVDEYINCLVELAESFEKLYKALLKNTELAFDVSEEEIFMEWGDRLIK